MKRRLLFIGGLIGLLTQKAKAQLELTQLKISQVKLLFSPTDFNVTEVNGTTNISLKNTQSPIQVSKLTYNSVTDIWETTLTPKMVFRNGLLMFNNLDYILVVGGVKFTAQEDNSQDIITIVT